MIRSRTVNKIHELAIQGKSIQDISIELGIARNTVRKYLRHPELAAMPHPRPNRRSKLDPFKEQVKKWIDEDHCYNCEAMLPRLLIMRYTGNVYKRQCLIPVPIVVPNWIPSRSRSRSGSMRIIVTTVKPCSLAC